MSGSNLLTYHLPLRQEIWLAVYSRSDLIGVTYVHLSLTDSLIHWTVHNILDAPTKRYFFYKKITQKSKVLEGYSMDKVEVGFGVVKCRYCDCWVLLSLILIRQGSMFTLDLNSVIACLWSYQLGRGRCKVSNKFSYILEIKDLKYHFA